MAAADQRHAESLTGVQHGSAAGFDPSADAPASASGLHEPAHRQHLESNTFDDVIAGMTPPTRRRVPPGLGSPRWRQAVVQQKRDR
jgi:hypothetical protein